MQARKTLTIATSAALLACLAGTAMGEGYALPAPLKINHIELSIQSGPINAPVAGLDADAAPADAGQQTGHRMVYSTEVAVADAPWLRLEFGQVDLAGDPVLGNGAYMVVTSAEDGYHQVLDAVSIRQWNNTSAYFNGDRVFIDVYAAPGTGASVVDIAAVQAGEAPAGGESICGSFDERIPNIDLRAGRMLPNGCTIWSFNNRPNVLATAGHCGSSSGQVAQFNVPLSNSNGSTRNPPPQDQYPFDGASIQSNSGSTTLGNDWTVFAVFANSNTGLMPLEANIDSYPLTTNVPPADGRPIRITGYGSTASPIAGEWNQAGKTHVGPFASKSGNVIRYQPDTTGGNSGSPVIDDSTGRVIGVHTNAGCTSTGGANQGTSLDNSAFRSAVVASRASNAGPVPAVIWTDGGAEGRPERVDPAGGDTIVVNMDADFTHTPPQPGSLRMQIDTGSGFQEIAPVSINGTAHTFGFPAGDCGSTVSYFFTAVGGDGTPTSWPMNAPAATFAVDYQNEVEIVSYNGNADAGFTVDDDPSLTTGSWDRGAPSNAGRGAPYIDADGSGGAWMTGENAFDEDVDGGVTRLVSPAIDLSGATDPILKFSYFHIGTASDDEFRAFVSSNNGASWTQVLVSGNTREWTSAEIRVLDHVALTSQFRVRFTSEDLGSGHVVESAVDAISVVERPCTVTGGCNGADLAEPFGELTFGDISAFLAAFNAQDPAADLAAPFGEFTFGDISAFLAAFSAGCP